MVKVEVIYAPSKEKIIHLYLEVADFSTIEEVIAISGLVIDYPEVSDLSVGIFSKIVARDTRIKANDRIEIYRSLQITPMDKRRQREKNSG